ncbi:protein phosphatase 2C domain-containing protein [Streptomyces sp. DSM 44915]|uniref:Protein phosphatase 2C domain-containing protein n=1 Tax=Streptomyces chisholmiae TaxID=3075540 RepID=A0ABU2JL15_9ACTN|nr:protein phosphatase 2C domain-containing protein [Streptomyces sp. DSM 44915]MDT0265655.1 protein phosphatase 2C domain-containing protein [Streptomyces sp. DSM 44915]
MRIQSATEPGSPGRPNEDFAATATPTEVGDGALVVLDGVTAPTGDFGCTHGVAWFSARLGGTLLRALTSAPARPLTDALAHAIERTADAHRGSCDLSHRRTPQATVVCCRWNAGEVEYLVLSDSALLVEESTGVVRPVLDDRLDQLRPLAWRQPAERRAAFVEAHRNAPDGFFTAAADPAVAARAVTGRLPRERVSSLAAVTDGVGRWTEVFGLGDWSALHRSLVERGPAGLIAEVRAAESADPAGAAFPRGKTHDDATAVLAVL